VESVGGLRLKRGDSLHSRPEGIFDGHVEEDDMLSPTDIAFMRGWDEAG
jgi:hypothetical protein